MSRCSDSTSHTCTDNDQSKTRCNNGYTFWMFCKMLFGDGKVSLWFA